MRFSHHVRKFSLYWIGIVTTLVAIFLITAWCITVKPLRFQAPIRGDSGKFSPIVKLTAEAISVDPISRTILMNWYPDFTRLNCSAPTLVMDIFLTSTLLDSSSPSWSSHLEDQPAYRLNTTEHCSGSMISAYSSFRTMTKIVASKEYLRLQAIMSQSTFQSYPFDIYIAPFLFYTKNVNTGATAPLEISDSFGVAVNFKISFQSGAFRFNGLRNDIQFFLRIERSIATKAFVIIVGVTNWLIAIAFLTICVALIVYQSVEIYSEMFVVPITTLFAFSSLRANFPGAPTGFGATIDLFTILPVLVIMSLCGCALLLAILYRRIYENINIKRRIRHGVNEQEMTATLQRSAEPHNLTVISIPDIRSPRSFSEVMRVETEVKAQGIVDSSISTLLDVPDIRSRRSSSESTRVQE